MGDGSVYCKGLAFEVEYFFQLVFYIPLEASFSSSFNKWFLKLYACNGPHGSFRTFF